jgi:hypothetical protein
MVPEPTYDDIHRKCHQQLFVSCAGWGLVGGMIGLSIGGWLGSLDVNTIRRAAIERGYMRHSAKTGALEWVEPIEEVSE